MIGIEGIEPYDDIGPRECRDLQLVTSTGDPRQILFVITLKTDQVAAFRRSAMSQNICC